MIASAKQIYYLGSFPDVIGEVVTSLGEGKLPPGALLSVHLDKSPPLYAIGRLLALAIELNRNHQVKTRFVLKSPTVNAWLSELGFIALVDDLGLATEFLPDQLELDLEATATPREYPKLLDVGAFGHYRATLVPLSKWTVEPYSNEEMLSEQIADLSHRVSSLVVAALSTHLKVEPKHLWLDVSKLLSGGIAELLSNALTHGPAGTTTAEVLFAMQISREAANRNFTRLPGSSFPAGTDKFDFLLMDTGQGILRSLGKTISGHDFAEADNDYFTLAAWRPEFSSLLATERHIIQRLWSGDLVIRRGRESEGFRDLREAVSWFGGVVNLMTGRSEITVSAQGSIAAHPGLVQVTFRPFLQPRIYFLPGVIIGASVEFYQLHQAALRAAAREAAVVTRNTEVIPCFRVVRLQAIPLGLLGGLSVIKVGRKSEIDAEEILALTRTDGAKGVIWNIDLRLSENIDVDYLDGLLQELAKKVSLPPKTSDNPFSRILFTNIPRNIIRALQSRGGALMLELKQTFCLMLDEADEFHFVGISRVSDDFFDLPEALTVILSSGGPIAQPELARRLKSPLVMDRLADIAEKHGGYLKYLRAPEPLFVAAPIANLLEQERRRHFQTLEAYRLTAPAGSIFQLGNGTFVDGIFDFCAFWGNEDVLSDCSKLMLQCLGFPFAHSIVAFMNNGDRLASSIQRIAGIPNLHVIGHHDLSNDALIGVRGSCVIILDVLYPGDDEAGPVSALVDALSKTRATAISIHAVADFRVSRPLSAGAVSFETRSRLKGIPVSALDFDKSTIRAPQIALRPCTGQAVLRRAYELVRTEPQREMNIDTQSPELSRWGLPWKYSPVELSAEFWQNVSTLRVLEPYSSGRDNRNVLFYENNERLVQNQRTRRQIVEFVADFVKNVVAHKVDVILHPGHSIGAYLAQQICHQLPCPPLVLPIRQPIYGGNVEIDADDYRHFGERIAGKRKSLGRDRLYAVIVDDSVLTGKSLFSMLGICSRLSLQPSGVMVLLSRLLPEVSAALRLLPIRFSYLYRLHMPMLLDADSPDWRLQENVREVMRCGLGASYFGQEWMAHLSPQDEKTPSFIRPDKFLEKFIGPITAEFDPDTVSGEWMETAQIRHVIRSLILHPDERILSFDARVAVVYNFLEQLIREKGFWELLRSISESAITANGLPSRTRLLLERILVLVAFSPYVARYTSVLAELETLSLGIIRGCISCNDWPTKSSLVEVALLSLGTVGSEKLFDCVPALLTLLAPRAFQELGGGDERQPSVKETERVAAVAILGATSASISFVMLRKGNSITGHGGLTEFLSLLPDLGLTGVGGIVAIDVLAPLDHYSALSKPLRLGLGIEGAKNRDEFAARLVDFDSEVYKYLSTAPGHTCTLLSLLSITQADTAMIYAKSSAEEGYFLRVYESKKNHRLVDDFTTAELLQSELPGGIRKRMDNGQPFVAERRSEVCWMDRYVTGVEHQWCIGGGVRVPPEKGMQYYVILGFVSKTATERAKSTGYYYWLKCERALQVILPSIHAVHFDSSTAWNAMVQSLKPWHGIRARDNDPLEIAKRRKHLNWAMSASNLGSLMRRAVRMYAEPVYRLREVLDRIKSVRDDLQTRLVHESRDSLPQEFSALSSLVICSSTIDELRQDQHCSLPMALIEFVVHEFLCNALSYFDATESIRLETGLLDNDKYVHLVISVENAINPLCIKRSALGGSGIAACEVAAQAVRGKLVPNNNRDERQYRVELQVPICMVPNDLEVGLYDIFTER